MGFRSQVSGLWKVGGLGSWKGVRAEGMDDVGDDAVVGLLGLMGVDGQLVGLPVDGEVSGLGGAIAVDQQQVALADAVGIRLVVLNGENLGGAVMLAEVLVQV